MSSDAEIQSKFFAFVDERKQAYIDRLAKAVSFPSISADPEHLDDIVDVMEWTKTEIERLGGRVTLRPNPSSTNERRLPPILMAEWVPSDSNKKTVCVYGHLDVQPADKDDGWDTDPFVLTEIDGKLYGRGSTDDKGPALSWLWVIEAHRDLRIELPVNIKLLYEGMEEFGSDGLFETIQEEAKEGGFLRDVDFFCISDNYWIGKTKPCLTYGLRGMAYFELSVKGCEQDLHSGVFGGTVHEAMTDLVRVMSTLVDSNGNILVEGIMDDVKAVTSEEDALYDDIEFHLDRYAEENRITSKKLLQNDKKSLLMARWRYPTLSLHGIEGAFSGRGAKTVIPAQVVGKFSLRLVPDQDPKKIEELVQAHISKAMTLIGTPNAYSCKMIHGAKPWLSSPLHPNFAAAASAIERVYNCKPDYTREGGSIPVASALEDASGMNVLLLPIGACDDMAHSQNEKYNVSNLLNGIKVLGIYLHELGKIEGPKPSSCRCLPLTEEELMIPGAFMRGFRCKCEM